VGCACPTQLACNSYTSRYQDSLLENNASSTRLGTDDSSGQPVEQQDSFFQTADHSCHSCAGSSPKSLHPPRTAGSWCRRSSAACRGGARSSALACSAGRTAAQTRTAPAGAGGQSHVWYDCSAHCGLDPYTPSSSTSAHPACIQGKGAEAVLSAPTPGIPEHAAAVACAAQRTCPRTSRCAAVACTRTEERATEPPHPPLKARAKGPRAAPPHLLGCFPTPAGLGRGRAAAAAGAVVAPAQQGGVRVRCCYLILMADSTQAVTWACGSCCRGRGGTCASRRCR